MVLGGLMLMGACQSKQSKKWIRHVLQKLCQKRKWLILSGLYEDLEISK